MKNSLLPTALLLPLVACTACVPMSQASAADAPAKAETPPNIIFILADDLGYGDVHALNPKRGKIATPCLDRMAAQGMAFTDAHSSSSVCTPSRYGLLTGRYDWRTQLQHGVLNGESKPLIAANRLTVAGMLKQKGYATACIGKWHLGMDMPKPLTKPDGTIADGPITRGFDHYFGISASLDMPPYAFIEQDRFTKLPTAKLAAGDHFRAGPGAPGFKTEDVLPTLVAHSKAWIVDHKKEPFFLYMPLNSPHTPIVPTAAWRGKSGLGAYGDFVMETDWAIGEVLNAVDASGLGENTLVIVSSDNGCSPHAKVDELEHKGHFPSANLRGYKSDAWDGGHRVPFIARWPSQVKPDSHCDQMVCLNDFMATCADMAGAKVPETAAVDSVSLLPLLKGSDKPVRDTLVHHSIYGNFAIRDGQWKLVLCPGSGGWSAPSEMQAEKKGLPAMQLYDMRQDVGERKNLQAQHPEIVARLKAELERIVADGRSTPGPKQANDVPVKIIK